MDATSKSMLKELYDLQIDLLELDKRGFLTPGQVDTLRETLGELEAFVAGRSAIDGCSMSVTPTA